MAVTFFTAKLHDSVQRRASTDCLDTQRHPMQSRETMHNSLGLDYKSVARSSRAMGTQRTQRYTAFRRVKASAAPHLHFYGSGFCCQSED
jgi:hypothetical protein